MCDSDKSSKDFFKKHLELMHQNGEQADYQKINTVEEFFNIIGEKDN